MAKNKNKNKKKQKEKELEIRKQNEGSRKQENPETDSSGAGENLQKEDEKPEVEMGQEKKASKTAGKADKKRAAEAVKEADKEQEAETAEEADKGRTEETAGKADKTKKADKKKEAESGSKADNKQEAESVKVADSRQEAETTEETDKDQAVETPKKAGKKKAAEAADESLQKNRRLRLGILSAVMVVGVIAIAVILNVVVGTWNVSWDMSQEGIYSISEQSKSIVRGLEQDITIYILDSEEGFPIGFKQILQQYVKNSNHINVVYRDGVLYPNFAYEYVDTSTTVNPDSIIVVCGDRYVYLDSDEFARMGLSSDGNSYGTILEFEPLLTSAINSVNDGETMIVYQTTGHNELLLTNSVQTGMMRDNFELGSLSLLAVDAVPEETDILLIYAPTTDFSQEDCDKVRAYLDEGGKVCYIMEATVTLEHLEELMKDYGITAAEGIVMEQDLNRVYGAGTDSATPTYIIPFIEDTEITHDLYAANLALLVPIAKGLTEQTGSGCNVTGLLSTSAYAYSKVNLYSEYISREDDDILGPFYLAMLSEGENESMLLVLASSNVLADNVNEVVSGNNNNFFLNGLNYLIGDTDKISIRGKEIAYDSNVYTSRQVYLFGGIAIIGIPVLILAAGIVVVLIRRKHSQAMKRSRISEAEEETGEDTEIAEEETEETEEETEGTKEETEGTEEEPEETGEETE